MLNQMQESFRSIYKSDPDFIVRAPGRVNLIGEHTDYNDGFVLPYENIVDIITNHPIEDN